MAVNSFSLARSTSAPIRKDRRYGIGLAILWLLAWCSSGFTQTNRLTPAERMQPERLQAAHEARERFARQRVQLPELSALQDFRAVIHVHAEDSDHTKGTREEVLAAAKKTGVRIVLFTDHRGPKPETWRGLRDGVLFLAGSEDGDGKLRFPAVEEKGKTNGELKFVTHVEERPDADTKGFAGMEIVNRHSDLKLDPRQLELLEAAAKDPVRWRDLVELFRKFPDEVFAAGCDYRPELVAPFDRATQQRRLTAIGANDAHQNVALKGTTFDPYEVSFRNLSTHILAPELTDAAVREALREGHCYVSHDWLCDPTGFVFGAVNNLGVFPMGDTAPMQGSTKLMGLVPVAAHLKLFHQGTLIAETNGTNLTFTAKKPGPYRLEAWLPVAGEERVWIYSNPVYLEEHSFLSMRLPNGTETPSVEVRKDISYKTGRPEDAAKHRLDLFLPKQSQRAPVFMFFHGGAWRFGDKRLYPPLGQRFARDGILAVIPSYRLAPKNPWPAQIEDVADAFAWTVKHIAEHGGDTNRIFIGGHSAGGHLTSLLALHPEHLRKRGLSPAQIRGVVSISGVYDLDVGEAMSQVFGTGREVRRDASPQFFVKSPVPPFFVSYCEWDYAMLPAQALRFDAALRQTGASSQLFFTPRDNHIYEIISMTHDDEATGQAVVKFIREH